MVTFYPLRRQRSPVPGMPKLGRSAERYPTMNRRLEQLCAEILNLYRQQLNALDKTAKLEDADLRQYDRRRDRIAELLEELENCSR
jgi:hypothetical protein